jgi:hypothetical protein
MPMFSANDQRHLAQVMAVDEHPSPPDRQAGDGQVIVVLPALLGSPPAPPAPGSM